MNERDADLLEQLALLDAEDARKAVESVLGKGAVVDLKDPDFYFNCPCETCSTPAQRGRALGV